MRPKKPLAFVCHLKILLNWQVFTVKGRQSSTVEGIQLQSGYKMSSQNACVEKACVLLKSYVMLRGGALGSQWTVRALNQWIHPLMDSKFVGITGGDRNQEVEPGWIKNIIEIVLCPWLSSPPTPTPISLSGHEVSDFALPFCVSDTRETSEDRLKPVNLSQN